MYAFHFRYFEELACEIIKKAYSRNREMSFTILDLAAPGCGDDGCVKLAFKTSCKKFVGHTVVQKRLLDKWHGVINPKTHKFWVRNQAY